MRLIAVAAVVQAWPPKTAVDFFFFSSLTVWALALDFTEHFKR